MPIVPCPRCRADLDVDAADLGHGVECPLCQTAFTARPPVPPPPPPRYENADDRPSRRPRSDDRPPDPRQREREAARALAAVARPANAMAWAASIAIAFSLFAGGGLVVLGLSKMNGGGRGGNDGVEAIVWGVIGGGVGLALHVPMLVGAHRAKRLDGTGWGTLSAALGITACVLCSWCFVSWFTLGFGVWLLVAVNKPEVLRTVRRNQRDREARRRDMGRPPADDDGYGERERW